MLVIYHDSIGDRNFCGQEHVAYACCTGEAHANVWGFLFLIIGGRSRPDCWVVVLIQTHLDPYFQKILYILSEDLFHFTNSVDPDEMPHFIWVFTVCKNTHLGFPVTKG